MDESSGDDWLAFCPVARVWQNQSLVAERTVRCSIRCVQVCAAATALTSQPPGMMGRNSRIFPAIILLALVALLSSAVPATALNHAGPVRELTATPGDGQVELSWRIPLNARDRVYFRWQPTSGDWHCDDWEGVDSLDKLNALNCPWVNAHVTIGNYTATGLVNGETYTIDVRNVWIGATNLIVWSPITTITATPNGTVPSPVSNLQATPGVNQVDLSWTLPSSSPLTVTHSQVRHKVTTDADFGPWTDVAAPASSHTVSGLECCTAYTFEVRTKATAGVSSRRNVFVTTSQPDLPSFPSGASVAALSLTQGVAYTGPVLPQGQGVNTPLVHSVSPALPAGLTLDAQRRITGTPTGFQSSRSYNYTVTDSKGQTASLPFTITVGATSPTAPTLGVASRGGHVYLKWSGGGYNNGWEFAQSSTSGTTGTWQTVRNSNANTRAHTVRSLTAGDTYHFTVRAVNGAGGTIKGPASPQVAVTVVTTAGNTDYDTDNDGLIEVKSLDHLNAIRWDLDTTGASTDPNRYAQAFPDAAVHMGCANRFCTGYELAADLSFDTNNNGRVDSGDDYWNGSVGWLPIGLSDSPFVGLFDATGHSIDRLWIRRGSGGAIPGLFGVVGESGEIRGARLTNVDVEALKAHPIGPLASENRGTITGSSSSGRAKRAGSYNLDLSTLEAHFTDSATGGLVGYNTGTVLSSSSSVKVTGRGILGGLVGANQGGANKTGRIHNSSATSDVTLGGTGVAGGLVGVNWNGLVSASHAGGAVNASAAFDEDPAAGGLVGLLAGSGLMVDRSYATGDVTVDVRVVKLLHCKAGGLIGHAYLGSLRVENTYSAGAVTHKGGQYCGVGPLIGTLHFNTIVGLTNSYSISSTTVGTTSGTGWNAGLAGYLSGDVDATKGAANLLVTNSYYDTRLTGIPDDPDFYGRGLAGSRMRTPTGPPPVDRQGLSCFDDLYQGDATYCGWDPAIWDFGGEHDYPELKADWDGDGTATSEEFGSQPHSYIPALRAEAGNAEVTLRWTISDRDDGATGWEFAKSTSEGTTGNWIEVPNSTATTTMHREQNLTNDTVYYFRVRSVKGSDRRQESNEASAKPFDTTPTFLDQTITHQEFIRGVPVELLLPLAVEGNGELSYDLSPSLPPGLNIDLGDRLITGTPTAVRASRQYTWSATDTDNDRATLTFNITVVEDLVPTFGSATIDDQQYIQHSTIEGLTLPEATGGNPPLAYTLTPVLPMGLTLDETTRAITGTPALPHPATLYTYEVTDRDNDPVRLTFTVTVEEDVAPSFDGEAIPAQLYTQNMPIEPVTLPQASSGNGDIAYSVTPPLPAGLSFDADTRRITGTPTGFQQVANYTYVATDTDGDTTSLNFNITVMEDLMPSFGDLTIADQLFTQHTPIATLTLPGATGGDGVPTYSLTPALATGLSFDADRLQITGIPQVGHGPITYTYVATDTDGDTASLSFDITISDDLIPRFVTSIANRTFRQNTPVGVWSLPEATGGDGELTYAFAPALPLGMTLDLANKRITGTPTRPQAATTHTYRVTDSDEYAPDSVTLTFTITVNAEATPTDYDADNDGLIEIGNLAQLNAMRWDLDGDGGVSPGDQAAYRSAFGNPAANMGCPSSGCEGYELITGLDFDTNADGRTDTAGDQYWNNGAGWSSIGLGSQYSATFDGNLHPVTNMHINWTGGINQPVGLFARVSTSGKIQRVALSDFRVQGKYYAGGLAGSNHGRITNSVAQGSVSISDETAGGLVGENRGTISYAASEGSVRGRHRVGGLVGDNTDGTITNSYSTARARGDRDRVGGLVGELGARGTIINSYATGDVSGNRNIGGLVGYHWRFSAKGRIENSYSTGTVSGSSYVGGLIGRSYRFADIRNAYWDTTTSRRGSSAGGAGRSTADLQRPTDSSGIFSAWDDRAWYFGNTCHYPALIADLDGDGRATFYEFGDQPRTNDPTCLDKPFEFTADGALGDVVLNWIYPSNSTITKYQLRHKQGNSFASSDDLWMDMANSSADTTTHTVLGLEPGVEYVFQVRAVNDSRTGPPSDPATATPKDVFPTFGDQTIADLNFDENTAIDTLVLPMATGGNAPLTYAISPGLPSGLTFDAELLRLSGTPTQALARATFTYTVTDADVASPDSDSLTFAITIAPDHVPTFGAETVADVTYIQNSPMELLLPEATSGNGDLSYTLEPALPTGMRFDPDERTISGTARVAQATTTYTYTVADADTRVGAADEDFLTFDITVDVDLVPNLGGQTVADQSYIENSEIDDLSLPAAAGGNGALSYTISPTLPAGLTFDPVARTITGTPTVALWTTTFTYRAGDADGNTANSDTASLTFNITVAADLVPSFGTRTIADQDWIQNSEIDNLTLPAASSGNGDLSYTISPALPRGLSFDPDTRTISGTPTVAKVTTTYTLTAADSDGNTASTDQATLTFDITVAADLVPSFGAGTVADQDWIQNSEIDDLALPAASSGNGALSYTITPALPTGLTFDPDQRTITGTPTVALASTTYTLTAADSDGNTASSDQATLTFDIAVAVDLVPSLGGQTVADQSYIQHIPIAALPLPAAAGGNDALSYTISPALPAGLTFDPDQRTITGTPTVARASVTFTYRAGDADGNTANSDTASLTFEITIVANRVPSFGTRTIAEQDYTQNSVIDDLRLPVATSGNGELTYVITPTLPAGLTFDADDRTVFGTPTTPQAAATYTYTVSDTDNNTQPSDTASLTFDISVTEDLVPSLDRQTISDQTFTQNSPIDELQLPAATGGNGDLTYVISPTLPAGLTLDATDLAIKGTPRVAQEATTYVYTAQDADRNTDSSDTAFTSFQITLLADLLPSFGTQTIPNQHYTQHQRIVVLVLPAATGGNGDLTYKLSPALPDGLSFNPATRTISGAPSTTQFARTYRYGAADSDGNLAASDEGILTFTIRVTAPPFIVPTPPPPEPPSPDPPPPPTPTDEAPSFGEATVPDQTFTVGREIEPVALPEASGGNGDLTYSITPTLPAGLTFNVDTRQISGTPQQPQGPTAYTYTVADADDNTEPEDQHTLTFTIEVTEPEPVDPEPVEPEPVEPDPEPGEQEPVEPEPGPVEPGPVEPEPVDPEAGPVEPEPIDTALNFGTATVPAQVYVQDDLIQALRLPEAAGGDRELTYSITPALPAGLEFDPSTRQITGAAVEPLPATQFTYRAGDPNSPSADEAALAFTLSVMPAATTLTALPGSDEVTLNWEAIRNVSNWEYQQDQGEWNPIPQSGSGTESHVVGGLAGNVTYAFKVRAVVGEAESKVQGLASNEVIVSPLPPPTPTTTTPQEPPLPVTPTTTTTPVPEQEPRPSTPTTTVAPSDQEATPPPTDPTDPEPEPPETQPGASNSLAWVILAAAILAILAATTTYLTRRKTQQNPTPGPPNP